MNNEMLSGISTKCFIKSDKTIIKIGKPILDYNQLLCWKAKIIAAVTADVILDLSGVEMMTTAAFAQLLIMKRELMQAGGDLHIQGLHDQPKELCKILMLCGLTEIKNL